MPGKGKNRGTSDSRRSEDRERQNAKDEAVHRDPDIGGVMRRESNDVHMRDRRDRG